MRAHGQTVETALFIATVMMIAGILEGCSSPNPAPSPAAKKTDTTTSAAPAPTPTPTTPQAGPTTTGQTSASPAATTTTGPTGPTTTSSPAPAPTPGECFNAHDPPICTTSECCKKNAKNPEDGRLCDDFYNVDVGISLSMLSMGTWQGSHAGSVGMDKALFSKDPQPKFNNTIQQAMTLTHYQKACAPYNIESAYGVAFIMGQESTFYRFFQKNKKEELCGQCTDGQHCAPVDWDRLVLLDDWSYDKFNAAKNPIMAQTGTKQCGNPLLHQYNEFDTNGLSQTDVAGVFVNGAQCRRNPPAPVFPDESTVCSFMKSANPDRTDPWPVYTYDYAPNEQSASYLYLERYLDCDHKDEGNFVSLI